MGNVNLLLIFLALSSNLDLSYQNDIPTPVVTTKSGQVVGAIKTLANGNKVNEYLGIRFAQPPIGELRFKKPVPVTPWKSTFNATNERAACMQTTEKNPIVDVPVPKIVSEDCLFLNIWTPNSPPQNMSNMENKKRSVMFYIYGGGLQIGSIFFDTYNGDYLASLGDVIIVSTNYRLNAFGFLYGGSDDDAPGNMGFHDQLLALKWVKENIASFGGDPDSITIFGESAGGWSVSAMMLSPLTHGLFKRAIIQSGTVNSMDASRSQNESLAVTKDFAMKLHCNESTLPEQFKCLRSKPAKELLNVALGSYINGVFGDEYLPLKPSEALKKGKLNAVDLLFGHTENEGSMYLMDKSVPDINKLTVEGAKSLLEFILKTRFKIDFGKKVAEFYLKGLKDEDKVKIVQAMASSLGDFRMICPTVTFSSAAAKWNQNNRAFAYVLAQAPAHTIWNKSKSNWEGVCHMEDLVYVFGEPLKGKEQWPQVDKDLSLTFIDTWTSFAKTG